MDEWIYLSVPCHFYASYICYWTIICDLRYRVCLIYDTASGLRDVRYRMYEIYDIGSAVRPTRCAALWDLFDVRYRIYEIYDIRYRMYDIGSTISDQRYGIYNRTHRPDLLGSMKAGGQSTHPPSADYQLISVDGAPLGVLTTTAVLGK